MNAAAPRRQPPPSLFALRPLLAAIVTIAVVGNDIIGRISFIEFLIGTFLSLDSDQLHLLLHRLWPIVWIFVTLTFLFSLVCTFFFLGYFPFETPASSDAPTGAANTASQESDSIACARPRLWLYECQHNQENFLCFPPYCAPGGLRSRLFPSSGSASVEIANFCSEEEAKEGEENKATDEVSNKLYRTTNSNHNPLDFILQSPYLPLPYFLKHTLQARQYDWNTLGGSKCSCKRNTLATEKELDLANRKTNNFSQPEVGVICERYSVSPYKHRRKTERKDGTFPIFKFRGLKISARRFVSQAVNSFLLTSEISQKHEQQVEHPQAQHENSQEREVPLTRLFHTAMTVQQYTGSTPPASAKVPAENKNPAGKPIPQAVLVYHESAHSIVFRDHLRRQQSAIRRKSLQLEAFRRTSSQMEALRRGSLPVQMEDSVHRGSSVSLTAGRRLHPQHSEPVVDTTLTPLRTPSTIIEVFEPDVGYESGGSRGSSHSARSGEESSTTSGGSCRNSRKVKSGLAKPLNHKKALSPTMQPVAIANFQPVIEPLESLDLDPSNIFEPLLDADPLKLGKDSPEISYAETEVVELLKNEQAVVKTIRNADWTTFFQKFKLVDDGSSGTHEHHPAHRKPNKLNTTGSEIDCPFNSFVTSTTLLPSCGKKMRCFGSINEYAVGAVFGMPVAFPYDSSEDDAAKRTRTWSWPSGYSAKTEFNIDHNGNLINGREEALMPLSGMKKMNHSYLNDEDYSVGGRIVKGGLSTIPYNEVYIRVGGLGRITGGVDLTTGKYCDDGNGNGRSFDNGIGLPIALFVRKADYGHVVRLLRTRARFSAIFGSDTARGIPLLYLTPERGVRVLTEKLQHQVLKTMAWDLNPFQNPSLAHRTSIGITSEPHLHQKLEELLDLDVDNVKQALTPEEMARIAGGFGATDECVAKLLNEAMQQDIEEKTNPLYDSRHRLQHLVNEGLAFALRANDYHTSRQLLILYTLVATKRSCISESKLLLDSNEGHQSVTSNASSYRSSKKWRDVEKNIEKKGVGERNLFRDERTLGKHYVPPPPPPPPLDTDRLRSATNSDGLLAVLGAAQVLRAMQDGSAKRRVKESIDSIEEWIENGEQSVAFRVASWRDQRAAQGDLKIAMENDSNFMAFISNKAISNRKKFAKQLRDAATVTEFDSLQFLKVIHAVLAQMNSPCLRLELLQYILGLDNRYSVAHVARSVELAATCLNLSESDVFNGEGKMLLK